MKFIKQIKIVEERNKRKNINLLKPINNCANNNVLSAIKEVIIDLIKVPLLFGKFQRSKQHKKGKVIPSNPNAARIINKKYKIKIKKKHMINSKVMYKLEAV